MSVRTTARRSIPARAGWPRWLFDHNPLGLALAGLSVVLATALFLDVPLHRVGGMLDPGRHRLFVWLTQFGHSAWAIVLSAVLCLWFNRRAGRVARPRDAVGLRSAASLAGFVLVVILASGVVANVLKWGLGRARPSLSDGIDPFAFAPVASSAGWASFPSGHATTTVALAVALGMLWPRLRLAFLTLAVWIAASRLMVGAHWASDVIAGMALGPAVACALRLRYARRGRVFVLRHGRLMARTASLGPLMRREIVALRSALAAHVAGARARLTGIAVAGRAGHPD